MVPGSEHLETTTKPRLSAILSADVEAYSRLMADDHRVRYRIGINIDDVIVEQERIYSDGINLAGIEAVAGGVAISAMAYDQIEGKLDLAFDDLGERDSRIFN